MNVVDLPAKSDIAASVEEMKRNLAFYIEMVEMNAKLQAAKYQAYVEAGFEPDQALFLLTNGA